MKVLCIKDSEDIAYTRKGAFKAPDSMKVFFGETYTVVDEGGRWHTGVNAVNAEDIAR